MRSGNYGRGGHKVFRDFVTKAFLEHQARQFMGVSTSACCQLLSAAVSGSFAVATQVALALGLPLPLEPTHQNMLRPAGAESHECMVHQKLPLCSPTTQTAQRHLQPLGDLRGLTLTGLRILRTWKRIIFFLTLPTASRGCSPPTRSRCLSGPNT